MGRLWGYIIRAFFACAIVVVAGSGAWAQSLGEPQINGPLGTKFHNKDTAERTNKILSEFADARRRCDARAMQTAVAAMERLAAQLPPFVQGQLVRIPPGGPSYSAPEARSADGSMVRSMVDFVKSRLDTVVSFMSGAFCFGNESALAKANSGVSKAEAAIKACDIAAYEQVIGDLNKASDELRGQVLRSEGNFAGASDQIRRAALQSADRLRELARHLARRKAAAFKDCKKPPVRVGRADTRPPVLPPRRRAPMPATFGSSEGLLAGAASNIATLIFEGGGLNVSSGNSSVNCPGCGAQGSQGVSPSGGFAGADLRFNIFALLSVLNIPPLRFTENLVLTGPFAGLRLRRYFNYRGDLVSFDFHPGGGDGINDTNLEFNEYWSAKTYLGLQFMLLNPLGPLSATNLWAIGIAPYIGINRSRGELKLRADETVGGGIANAFNKQITRNGMAYGVDIDFFFRNMPFFVGLGLQWDRMPETTIDANTAAFGFAYRGVIPGRTNFTAAFRFGMPLNFGAIAGPLTTAASDIRLKRDIVQVGRRPDGIGLYRYRYLWSDMEYVGVMAQEVGRIVPEAVTRGADGFLRVDYSRLGARMMTGAEWDAAGERRLASQGAHR